MPRAQRDTPTLTTLTPLLGPFPGFSQTTQACFTGNVEFGVALCEVGTVDQADCMNHCPCTVRSWVRIGGIGIFSAQILAARMWNPNTLQSLEFTLLFFPVLGTIKYRVVNMEHQGVVGETGWCWLGGSSCSTLRFAPIFGSKRYM